MVPHTHGRLLVARDSPPQPSRSPYTSYRGLDLNYKFPKLLFWSFRAATTTRQGAGREDGDCVVGEGESWVLRTWQV
jgi:hypothetical protein